MNRFGNTVGQKNAIRKINYWIDGARKTNKMPHLLLAGQKGDGKSHLARQIGEALTSGNSGRIWIPVNAASISKIEAFEMFISDPRVAFGEATIFVDEAHELAGKTVTALLTILELNADGRTQYQTSDGSIIEFQSRRVNWIFATTELHKLFVPLKDRMEQIDLEKYTREELSQIIEISYDRIMDRKGERPLDISQDLFFEMAGYIRQNGRDAFKMAEKIEANPSDKFGEEEWRSVKKSLSLRPMGLGESDLEYLQILRDSHPRGEPIGQIASAMAQPVASIKSSVESYLRRIGYVRVGEQHKRFITQKGILAIGEVGL